MLTSYLLIREARALYPYLPDDIIRIFVDEYIDNGGDAELALQTARQSPVYERYFPGNRRQDGTLRYTEQDYARQVDSYRHTLAQYDIPERLFSQRFGELIEGEVDAAEFRQRVDQVFVGVMSQGSQIRDWYAREYGIDVSDAALIANAIDPSKSLPELMLEINRAQVGSAAAESGFDIDLGEATRLQQAGLTQEAARNFYRRAQGLLPTLGDLVARNNDPDDEFTLDQLTDALIFSDPTQTRRIERAVAREEARFTGQGGVQERDGRSVGLSAR